MDSNGSVTGPCKQDIEPWGKNEGFRDLNGY